ncbi:MAG: bifunctional riboflavin kinase/FAD synthetase [Halanaerobiales bacterium]
MIIIKSNTFDQYEIDQNIIAIGSFDGIHKGHKKILDKTLSLAEVKGLKSGLLTFEPHPQEVVGDEKSHYYISSKAQKRNHIKDMGFDYYFEMNFSEDLAQTAFDDFVKKIVVNNLKTKHIVVGSDFKLGHKGDGNINKLRKLGKKYNFDVTAVKPKKIGEHKISSSVIRDLIKAGRLDELKDHLGNNFKIEGKVVEGYGRGRKLGIPTANIKPSTEYVLPPDGVYAVYFYLNDNKYKGVVNFGHKPTFNDHNFTIEVHLPNFEGDLYGEYVEIELVEFIRGEEEFEDVDELIDTIDKDILYIKELL